MKHLTLGLQKIVQLLDMYHIYMHDHMIMSES